MHESNDVEMLKENRTRLFFVSFTTHSTACGISNLLAFSVSPPMPDTLLGSSPDSYLSGFAPMGVLCCFAFLQRSSLVFLADTAPPMV
jgi:hypothetical protein